MSNGLTFEILNIIWQNFTDVTVRTYSHSHRPNLECPMQENRFRNDREIDNLNIINCVILILGA